MLVSTDLFSSAQQLLQWVVCSRGCRAGVTTTHPLLLEQVFDGVSVSTRVLHGAQHPVKLC